MGWLHNQRVVCLNRSQEKSWIIAKKWHPCHIFSAKCWKVLVNGSNFSYEFRDWLFVSNNIITGLWVWILAKENHEKLQNLTKLFITLHLLVKKNPNMAQDIPKSQGYIPVGCLQGQGLKLWVEKYILCEIYFYA